MATSVTARAPEPPADQVETDLSFDEWVKDLYREGAAHDQAERADGVLARLVRAARVREARNLFRRYRVAGPALDVGCGSGLVSAGLPADTIGLDLSPQRLAEAEARLPERRFVVGDAEALPFPDGSFGTLLATEVLADLLAPAVALTEFARVLRPGGVLIGMTPTASPLRHLGLVTRRHPALAPFQRDYTTAEVANLLRGARLTPLEVGYSLAHLSVRFAARKGFG